MHFEWKLTFSDCKLYHFKFSRNFIALDLPISHFMYDSDSFLLYCTLDCKFCYILRQTCTQKPKCGTMSRDWWSIWRTGEGKTQIVFLSWCLLVDGNIKNIGDILMVRFLFVFSFFQNCLSCWVFPVCTDKFIAACVVWSSMSLVCFWGWCWLWWIDESKLHWAIKLDSKLDYRSIQLILVYKWWNVTVGFLCFFCILSHFCTVMIKFYFLIIFSITSLGFWPKTVAWQQALVIIFHKY